MARLSAYTSEVAVGRNAAPEACIAQKWGRGQNMDQVIESHVVSVSGQRATKMVACLRLASAAAIAVVLMALGTVYGKWAAGNPVPVSSWMAVLPGIVAASFFAGLEISYGGAQARAEEKRIRAALLETVFAAQSLPRDNEAGFGSGRLIQLMTDNTERLTEYRQVYYGSTLATMLIPVGVLLAVAVFIDPVVGLVTLALVPFIPLLIWVFMRFFRRTSAESRRQRARLAGLYLDAIRNLVPIRMPGAGERIEAQLRDQGEANCGAIMNLLAGNQLVIVVVDGLFSLILICATTALAITRMTSGHIDVGGAVAVVFCTILLLEPLGQVAGFFYIGMGGMASEKAIGSYLSKTGAARTAQLARAARAMDAASTPQATQATQAVRVAPGSAVPEPQTGGIAIEIADLRFDYGRGEVLHGGNLLVPQGHKVAIVGRSGTGKSTLLSLLRGSLPIQTGRIALGGSSIADLSSEAIRALSASVSQKTWLFTGNIADNLRIARPHATDEELWYAVRRAYLADDIARMPLGLQTDVAEQGAALSGGQAQRLSLARALLSGRRVLLLDEPTSQVDVASEAEIVRAIAGVDSSYTLLVATHRRSLLSVMDSVYEMRDGSLTRMEEGVLA